MVSLVQICRIENKDQAYEPFYGSYLIIVQKRWVIYIAVGILSVSHL